MTDDVPARLAQLTGMPAHVAVVVPYGRDAWEGGFFVEGSCRPGVPHTWLTVGPRRWVACATSHGPHFDPDSAAECANLTLEQHHAACLERVPRIAPDDR